MKNLKILLFCGAIYFLLVSIVHVIGYKIPGLFIYFNLPSYPYQDKIISLLAFGWATFFFTGGSILSKLLIKSILICGAIAILILTLINLTTNFTSLSEKINPIWYHIETGLLVLYWTALLLSYNKEKEKLIQYVNLPNKLQK